MKSFSDRFDRQVIPGWHDSKAKALGSEAGSLVPRTSPSLAVDVETIREELDRTKSLGVAVDALNVALVASNGELASAAASIIDKKRTELPKTVVDLADRVLGRIPNELPILPSFRMFHGGQVRELRELLRAFPQSPLLHLDIARHFVTLGCRDKAARAVAAALTLAPHNRVVLRSAARFYSFVGEKDRAYALIRNAARTQADPWLIAAEIALSQEVNRPPLHWSKGRDFLERASVAPIHLSELATAVGTIELMSGNRKKARKLFAQGLRGPTANSLAQARWAELRMGMELVTAEPIAPQVVDHAFEARTLQAFNTGDMATALQAARNWFHVEPFSPLAASAVAHIGGLMDDYKTVMEHAELCRHVHPNDVSLRNNYLYAWISSGEIFRSGASIVSNDDDDDDDDDVPIRVVKNVVSELRGYIEDGGYSAVHALANLGLLAYRLGQPETGRTLYDQTIQLARRGNLAAHHAAAAAVFHAREAILAGVPWASETIATARGLAKSGGSGQSPAPSITFYMKKIEALAKDPQLAPQILSAESATAFAPAKLPVSLKLETKKDGGLIVRVPAAALSSSGKLLLK